MADHNGEIITGIAALGTFIGAALAAIRLRRKPEPPAEQPENGIQAMVRRSEELEHRHTRLENAVLVLVEQQRRAETDRDEAHKVIGEIFDHIRKVAEDVAWIKGRVAI